MLQLETIPPQVVRPRKRRVLRLFIFLVATFVLLLLPLVLFILFRGGKDYSGDLAQLLPENTASVLQLNNLEHFSNQLKKASIHEALTVHFSISELLVDDEDLQEIRQAGLPLDRLKIDALVNRFFRRWFGRNVLCAMVPLQNPQRPGFVALLRTQAGFEENLAELTSNLWPNAKRESTEYEGIPLTLFRGDDPQESIAYCRFGKTLAISFWEDSTEALKPVIDRRQERLRSNLSQDPLFAEFAKQSAPREGLAIFVQPRETFSLLKTYEKLRFEKHQRSFGNFIFARDLLSPLEAVTGHFYLRENGQELAARFQSLPTATTPMQGTPSRYANLPKRPLVVLQGASKNLQSTLLKWTFGFPAEAEVRQECDEWNKDFNKTFDIDLQKDVIPLIGDEACVAVTDVKPGLLLPAVELLGVFRLRDAKAMNAILERGWEHYQERLRKGKSVEWEGLQRLEDAAGKPPVYRLPLDLPGYLAATVHGDYLLLALPQESLEALKHGMGIQPMQPSGHGHDANAATIFSADLPALSNAIESVVRPLALWDKDIREDLAENQPLLDLLKHTGTLAISRHGQAIEVVLPLDSKPSSR